jgi:uncharacterized protein
VTPETFRLVAWGVAILAAIAGVRVVSQPGPSGRLTVARLLLASAVMAGVETISLVLLAGVAGAFGTLHLAYLALVVALPAVAFFVVARRAALRPTPGAFALAVLGLVPAGVGVWATFVEPYRLQVERCDVAIDARRDGKAPVRIGVLSDLQCDDVGEPEREAFRRIVEERPDVVLLPGDVFQHNDDEFDRAFPALRRLFESLDPPGGAFLVIGDVDTTERMHRLVAGTRVRFLADEIAETRVGDRRIRVLGLTLRGSSASRRALRAFEAEPGAGDVRIVLAHRPDGVLDLAPGTRVDLFVAGHTHGGQVQIPGFGPLVTLSSVPRDVAAGGLSDLDGRRIWVSRGVGRERTKAPPLRLFCPPDVGVLTLR